MSKNIFSEKILFSILIIFAITGQSDYSFCSELTNAFSYKGKYSSQIKTFYEINDKTIILSDSENLRNSLYLQQEIMRKTGLKIPVVNSKRMLRNRNMIVVSQSPNSHKEFERQLDVLSNREEGYLLSVEPHKIVIFGYNTKSTWYGVLSLIQLMRNYGPSQISVPLLGVVSEPTFGIRAVHLTFFDTLDIEYTKKWIAFLAKLKFNTLIIEIGNGIKYEKHPELSKITAVPKNDFLDLIRFSQGLFLNVIPELNTFGHQAHLLKPAYPELILEKDTYDPRNHEVYQITFDIMSEIIDLFKPKFFSIGHDEVYGLDKLGDPQSYMLFAEDIKKYHAFLKSRNIKTIMWGDMLLHKDQFKGQDALNGHIGNAYKAIDMLPKDIIIADWHYNQKSEEFPSSLYFINKGFKVLGAVFNYPLTTKNFATYISRHRNSHTLGMIQCLWYLLPQRKEKEMEELLKFSASLFWKP